jgi:chitin disaccharide deacetylase
LSNAPPHGWHTPFFFFVARLVGLRRLIVNADDFGYTSGVNRAILQAHTHGIVTSSTLMANGRAFTQAVDMAKSSPNLSVGCHVVLIDGQPVVEASKIATITDSEGFRDGLKTFVARALSGRMSSSEIESEAEAQIQKIQSTGLAVSHVDTHKHTHMFPQILRPLLRAARACGVCAVRNPFGPRFPLRSSQLLRRPNLWTRLAEVRVLSRFAKQFHRTVAQEGFATPDGTLGIEVTGTLDETMFQAIAESIPDGTWEFVCHPGYNDAELAAAKTRLRESRELELRVLTMPKAREILAQTGVQLISYRDLRQ